MQPGTRGLLASLVAMPLLLSALLLLLAGLAPTARARAAASNSGLWPKGSRSSGSSSLGQGRRPLPPLHASRSLRRDKEGEAEDHALVNWLMGARGGRSGNYYGQGGGGYGSYDGYDDYDQGGYDGYEDDGYGGDGRQQQQQPGSRQRRPQASRSSRNGRAGSSSSGGGGFGGVGFSLDQPMPPSLRRAGFTLLGASLVLTMMGVSLFFERNLLRLGNLCLILGLPLYFGPARVMRLLFNKDKLRASACFCLGVFLVLRGNSFLGTLLEVFGFFNLFANMFPLLLALLRNVPIVGELLKRPDPSSSRRDSYYDRGDYDRGYGGGGGGRDRW